MALLKRNEASGLSIQNSYILSGGGGLYLRCGFNRSLISIDNARISFISG